MLVLISSSLSDGSFVSELFDFGVRDGSLVSSGVLEVSIGLGGKGDLKHNNSSLFLLLGSLGELHNLEGGDLSVLVESLDLSSDKLGEGNDVGDGSAGSSEDDLIEGLFI